MKYKVLSTKYKVKGKIIILLTTYFLILSTLLGCDAFVRKFTRKPKKDRYPQEELVLEPEPYKPTMTNEQQYRQYLLFWKSWQDELITALMVTPMESPNHKKQIDCANEAVKNLMGMRKLLDEKGQKRLDVYIGSMTDLRESIAKDTYSMRVNYHRQSAERLRRSILQDFSAGDVKNSLL